MSGRREESRRRFLKNSAATAVAGLLGTTAGPARSAHVTGSDEIKIALIGCGGRGTGAAAQALHMGETRHSEFSLALNSL